MSNASLDSLIRIENGLRAELGVLRDNHSRFVTEDALEEYSFSLEDAQLAAMKETKELLRQQLELKRKQQTSTLQAIKALSIELDLKNNSNIEEEEAQEMSLEDLKKEVLALRRKALSFAKEQWPVSQDIDQFEGGDFWDACVAACSNPEQPIDYSDRETGFAELLIQAGVANRIEDFGNSKRIKLASEIFEYNI